MSVAHESVVLKDAFPVLLILSLRCIGSALSKKLLDSYLMRVKVLEDKVAEEGGLVVLLELNLKVGLAGPSRLVCLLAGDVAVGLDYLEPIVFLVAMMLVEGGDPHQTVDVRSHFQ